MDESFSAIVFINDEEDKEEFENIDYLFGQIPDEVFTAVVNSASSEHTAEPHNSPVVANLSSQTAANCSN